MRKIAQVLAAAALLLAALLGSAAAVGADPAFGPGNGSQVGTPVCHPPGQVSDLPQCK